MAFRSWSFTSKWTFFTALLTFIVLLAQTVGSFKSLEPYFIATRGWVRAEAVAIAKEQNATISAAQQQNSATLKLLIAQQLTTQKLIYEGQERAMRAELIDIDLRLRDAPTDSLLLRRRADIAAALDDIAHEQAQVSCQLRRQQSPGEVC